MSDNSKPKVNALLQNYDSPWNAVITDALSQDNFIITNGVMFKHYKALPCILGKTEEGQLRHSHDHEFDGDANLYCENGFIYRYCGDVWAVFTGNSKNLMQTAPGFINSSTAYVTFNRYYRGKDELAAFTEYDKLIPVECPKEFFHSNWQELTHNPTGIDRTQFKIEEIEIVMDSDGVFYSEGSDFIINERGSIQWIAGGKRPGFNNITGKPKLVSVRYKYMPYFYIKHMSHEIRIVPQIDHMTGEIKNKKMPMQAVIVADWVFLDARTDSDHDEAQLEDQDSPNTGPR